MYASATSTVAVPTYDCAEISPRDDAITSSCLTAATAFSRVKLARRIHGNRLLTGDTPFQIRPSRR